MTGVYMQIYHITWNVTAKDKNTVINNTDMLTDW